MVSTKRNSSGRKRRGKKVEVKVKEISEERNNKQYKESSELSHTHRHTHKIIAPLVCAPAQL